MIAFKPLVLLSVAFLADPLRLSPNRCSIPSFPVQTTQSICLSIELISLMLYDLLGFE